MKKHVALIVCLSMVASLFAACSQGSTPAESTAPASSTAPAGEGQQSGPGTSQEETTLRIVWWGSQTRHDMTLEVIDMYLEQNPHITMEPEFMAWNNYFDKLASQAAASTMPDIMQNDYNYIETYATKGLNITLEPYIGDAINLDDVDEVYLSGGRVGGDLYGISIGSGGPTIIYDPAVFQQLGIEEPGPTWTYEDYEEAMQAIRDGLNIFGATMLYDGGIYRGFEAYCRQLGQSIYNEQGDALNFDKQLFIDYYTMHTDWQERKLVATPDVLVDAKQNIEADLLCTNRSAMVWRNSNQIVSMTAAADRTLKMTTIPMHKDQVQYGGYIKPNMFWSITKDAGNEVESARFINYFTNDVDANLVLMAERGVPISAAVRDAMRDSLGEAEQIMFAYIDDYVNYASPMDPPQPASFAEITELMDNFEQRITYGETTPEQAADDFFVQAEEAIRNTAS